MKSFRIFACASASLVALAAPSYAQAQTAKADAAAEVTDADTITVTARRRDEARQDVPLVVNVVNSEAIAKLNLREGSDVQNLVPGLELRKEANGIGSAGQVRGIKFDANTSAKPTVEFYLNDAPIDGGLILQAMYDIGQVEVLRGPQGTLRGTASPSGSITFTTRKPNLTEFGATLTGTINDIGLRNLNGAINVPVIKDILGVRVSGLIERSKLNRVHSNAAAANLAEPYARTDSVRAIATFKPADWLKLEGMYQIMQRDTSSYDQYASYSLVSPTALVSPVLIRPEDRLSIQETARTTDQRFETFNWRAEVRFAGQALIYQGARYNLRFHAVTNQDGANFFLGRDTLQDTTTNSSSTSHEVRLQNEERVLGMFDYVVGYFTKKQVSPTNLTVQTAVRLPTSFGGGIATVVTTPIFTGGDPKESSFFGNITAHLGDRTELSAGLRHIHATESLKTITIGTNTLNVGPVTDDNNIVYSFSIKHKLTPDVMIYASTGSSRRPAPSIVNPGVSIRSPLMNSFIQLQPENSKSYELGLKSEWFDHRLVFNLTGFYQKFDGYPYKISDPVFYQSFDFPAGLPVPAVGNGSQFGASVPVTVKGVELEMAWKVTRDFNIGLIASYADGNINNGTIPCNDLNGDGVPDAVPVTPTVAQLQTAYGANFMGACKVSQRSSNQSPFSATLTADYTHPISDKMEVFARGLFNLYGASKVEPTNSFDDLGSYGLLNLFAGVRAADGGWEVNFFAKNVFNTIKATQFGPPAVTSYQQLSTSFVASGASATSPYSPIQTNAPREFGVTLRVAFGSR